MEQTVQTSQTSVRHKTFTYSTQVEWVGGRAGITRSEGKQEFRVASPPEFKGEKGVWTPEDLLVAAVNSCMMTTFMSFAGRLKLPVVSYTSSAEGTLEFVEDGHLFTKVTIRPAIIVERDALVEQARKALNDAHEKCLIKNSLRSAVIVEPIIHSLESR